MSSALRRLQHLDDGATMVEYGIMLAFVAAIMFVVLTLLGLDVFSIFSDPRLDLP